MENNSNPRRQFLKMGATAAGAGLFASTMKVAHAVAQQCIATPPQTSGPFYPGESRFGQNTDLTRIEGHTTRAEGQIIYIRGKVVDAQCRPIVGANVEIWQASASGRYNNPKDPNPAPIDPHFRYWAETFTDESGEYGFKSIIPGAYPADTDWVRPPHIHYRVTKLGFRELVTQMYFAGNEHNDRDYILQAIPERERSTVIVDFKPVGPDLEPGALIGEFDVTMTSVRG